VPRGLLELAGHLEFVETALVLQARAALVPIEQGVELVEHAFKIVGDLAIFAGCRPIPYSRLAELALH